MPEVSAEVMELVQSELTKNPEATNQELYEKAAEAYPAVQELDLRQFNARYTLQAKRALGLVRAGAGARGAPAKATKRAARVAAKGRAVKAAAKRAAPPARRAARPAAATDPRQAIRYVLVQFAAEATKAQSVAEFLTRVDGYVDQILAVTG